MAKNPFNDNTQKVRRATKRLGLGIARVMQVPDDSAHNVVVKPLTETGSMSQGPVPATVGVDSIGDVALPSEGDLVVYGRFNNDTDLVVLRTIYSKESSIRSYEAGERHVSGENGVWLHGPFAAAPKVESDPADAPDGVIWYREDLDEYRGRKGGSTVTFDTTDV